MNLLECLKANNCQKFIFSSSATVYGDAPSPVKEDSHVGHGITNPYGQTKFMIETILTDFGERVERAPFFPIEKNII